jgi:hypothetical protein
MTLNINWKTNPQNNGVGLPEGEKLVITSTQAVQLLSAVILENATFLGHVIHGSPVLIPHPDITAPNPLAQLVCIMQYPTNWNKGSMKGKQFLLRCYEYPAGGAGPQETDVTFTVW